MAKTPFRHRVHLTETARRHSIASLTLAIALIFETATSSAEAQPADIAAMRQRLETFYKAGNYNAALLEAQKLEETVKTRYGESNPNHGLTLGLLSNVYHAQGKYTEAEEVLKRVLVIFEQTRGNEINIAATLGNLARLYDDQGHYSEEEAALKRALTIYQRIRGGELRRGRPCPAPARYFQQKTSPLQRGGRIPASCASDL